MTWFRLRFVAGLGFVVRSGLMIQLRKHGLIGIQYSTEIRDSIETHGLNWIHGSIGTHESTEIRGF